MIKALKKQDYILASKEMENSLWKKQTPKRVLKLSKAIMVKKLKTNKMIFLKRF